MIKMYRCKHCQRVFTQFQMLSFPFDDHGSTAYETYSPCCVSSYEEVDEGDLTSADIHYQYGDNGFLDADVDEELEEFWEELEELEVEYDWEGIQADYAYEDARLVAGGCEW